MLVALLLGETTINYIDRQVLSVLAPQIRDELKLSNSQYATVINAFLFTYMAAFAAAGAALDRIGVGRGLSLSVVWWSIAGMLTALSRGLWSLSFMRALLAVGEAAAWPGFAKAVAQWVPPAGRPLAIGACNAGSSIGAMIAPPLVVWIAQRGGWRAAFVVTGLLGLAWVAAFQVFRARHPRMEIHDRGASGATRTSWISLLRYRQTWAVFLCRFLADPMWYFYVFWIPEFLARERGMNLDAIGAAAGIPFLAAGLANFAAGYLSMRLQNRGWTVNRTRKTMMIGGALLAPVGTLAVFAQSIPVTMALMSGAIFVWNFWSVSVHSLAGDYFPARLVGSAYGIGAVGSTLGSAIGTWAVGYTLDLTHSYTPVFIAIGVSMPVALAVRLAVMGRVERIENANASPY